MVFGASSTLAPFLSRSEILCVAVCEPLHEEIVVELFKDFGIWKIVAHIAFKFYSDASETFSTGSTFWVRGAVLRVLLNPS